MRACETSRQKLGRSRFVDPLLVEFETECERAADEFLLIEGWNCPKWKVRAAVEELRSGSPRSSAAMSWLLRQTTTLPVQAAPNRRLHDLVQAIAARRNRQLAVTNLVAAE